MEKLLNKLIEKGWKPRGENVELYGTSKNTFGERIVIFIGNAGGFKKWGGTYRELVSKESGLWQFVCENRMVEYKNYWVDTEIGRDEQYKYRLIESSLKDEDELEQFLLDNIKIYD